MDSLNTKHGKTLSELELTFNALNKLLSDKLRESPNSGYIMAKGKPNEARVKYSQVLANLESLRDLFGMKGAFSFGTCQTCTKFDPSGFSNGFGHCKSCTDLVHKYGSCSNHSVQGGGFGL